ncbi:T6SS phospholipase effector Tle1-like catalytic domain-containing protein [Xenorhabdus griffiniae]|uniref:DUF2235 domain-containing protein n=1 Tax=Xenorhabdus griffiniae TaxID=351672 RepID=A0ABY9XJ12_9GAMM|nr:DUF2235 domain-containing protein [Xenorhabdus griffiniae]MBD1227221.1 DUF2235 domain-containing protein [Xenorhabdus griffiniae]MBE8586975.1 DUF2235 domain-containing protein [Xenorhabdus griffiniae]WMV72913.1 DUF2235 domain-containing protein [Xenorhabdus griffiniae]WNH02592.1 DUF2235 domain-containing protein [Xenorhabdus griffiniae]
MKPLDPTNCIDCQNILKNWIEFQLVDEQGNPLIGIPYKLKSRGNKSIVRAGTTDGKGILREEDLPPMPVTLSVSAQPLADKVVQCPARPDTGKIGNLQVRENSYNSKHDYRYITLGAISDAYPKVKGWQEDELKTSEHFKDSTLKGFTAHPLNRRYVLEVQAIESGITLTIGVFFDGTGNNTDNINERLLCIPEATNINQQSMSCSFNQFGLPGDTSRISYDGYYTNVHFLHKTYINEKIDDNSHQIKVYIEGIGTQAGKSDSVVGYGLGIGETGVHAKTEMAIQKIKTELTESLKSIRENIKCLQFDIIGFSRGAAAARHFANRVFNHDPVLEQALADSFNQHHYLGKSSYPTGKNRFLGIFDTVAAIGTLGNGLNPHSADTGDIDIRLPAGIAEHIFQITAMNECRYNFSLNSIKPDYPELIFPGAHSDIGGGYNPTETERLFITRPRSLTVDESTPNNTTWIYKKAQDELSQMRNYPAIAPLLHNNEVKVETWQNNQFYPRNDLERFQKQVAVAAVLYREITNDWSKVVMLVMKDAAQEAGVIFGKPNADDKDYQLCPELTPLVEKALNQGRAVRQGQPFIPFNEEELALIQTKYVHCSSHWNSVVIKEEQIQGGVNAVELISFVNRPCAKWHRAIFDMAGKEIS